MHVGIHGNCIFYPSVRNILRYSLGTNIIVKSPSDSNFPYTTKNDLSVSVVE